MILLRSVTNLSVSNDLYILYSIKGESIFSSTNSSEPSLYILCFKTSQIKIPKEINKQQKTLIFHLYFKLLFVKHFLNQIVMSPMAIILYLKNSSLLHFHQVRNNLCCWIFFPQGNYPIPCLKVLSTKNVATS